MSDDDAPKPPFFNSEFVDDFYQKRPGDAFHDIMGISSPRAAGAPTAPPTPHTASTSHTVSSESLGDQAALLERSSGREDAGPDREEAAGGLSEAGEEGSATKEEGGTSGQKEKSGQGRKKAIVPPPLPLLEVVSSDDEDDAKGPGVPPEVAQALEEASKDPVQDPASPAAAQSPPPAAASPAAPRATASPARDFHAELRDIVTAPLPRRVRRGDIGKRVVVLIANSEGVDRSERRRGLTAIGHVVFTMMDRCDHFEGGKEAVERLIDSGWDINNAGVPVLSLCMTAFMRADRPPAVDDAVKFLFACGADPNAGPQPVEGTSDYEEENRNPMELVVEEISKDPPHITGLLEFFKMLVDGGGRGGAYLSRTIPLVLSSLRPTRTLSALLALFQSCVSNGSLPPNANIKVEHVVPTAPGMPEAPPLFFAVFLSFLAVAEPRKGDHEAIDSDDEAAASNNGSNAAGGSSSNDGREAPPATRRTPVTQHLYLGLEVIRTLLSLGATWDGGGVGDLRPPRVPFLSFCVAGCLKAQHAPPSLAIARTLVEAGVSPDADADPGGMFDEVVCRPGVLAVLAYLPRTKDIRHLAKLMSYLVEEGGADVNVRVEREPPLLFSLLSLAKTEMMLYVAQASRSAGQPPTPRNAGTRTALAVQHEKIRLLLQLAILVVRHGASLEAPADAAAAGNAGFVLLRLFGLKKPRGVTGGGGDGDWEQEMADLLELLLEKGLDLHCQLSGAYLLDVAINLNAAPAIMLLSQHGAPGATKSLLPPPRATSQDRRHSGSQPTSSGGGGDRLESSTSSPPAQSRAYSRGEKGDKEQKDRDRSGEKDIRSGQRQRVPLRRMQMDTNMNAESIPSARPSLRAFHNMNDDSARSFARPLQGDWGHASSKTMGTLVLDLIGDAVLTAVDRIGLERGDAGMLLPCSVLTVALFVAVLSPLLG